MREVIGYLRKQGLKESTIDYPREDLCPNVWDKEGDTYRIKPSVEKKIHELLSVYRELDLTKIKPIHIIGSLGTNQYKDTADLDVHLVVEDESILPQSKSASDWQRDVFRFYKIHRNELDGYVGDHPVEVYLQLNPAQEMLSDSLYDLATHKWLQGPKIVPEDHDPYDIFADIVDDISSVVGDTDKLLGELKRDVIDYDVILTAIKELDGDAKEKLLERLRKKVDEIESSIAVLMKNKKEWIIMRKKSSSPTTEEQAKEDSELAKTWASKEALFKFIGRYQYMRVISELEKMMDDYKISDKEVNVMKSLLGVQI